MMIHRKGEESAQKAKARLQSLEALLSVVSPVEIRPQGETACFGAWVELEDENGARAIWRLVGPDEADVASRQIRVEAPLGRALLGK